jgi:hypothetical protein
MKRLAAVCALAFAPLAAHAQFFIEGALGKAKADLDDFRDQGFLTDRTANSGALGVGYMFNRFIGFEAGYRQLGEARLRATGAASATIGDQLFVTTGDATLKVKSSGAYVGPVFETFVGRFDLIARAGMFIWKSEFEASGAGAFSANKTDGMDPYAGVGIAYRMTPRTSAGVSWTRFKVLEDVRIEVWDLRLKFYF